MHLPTSRCDTESRALHLEDRLLLGLLWLLLKHGGILSVKVAREEGLFN